MAVVALLTALMVSNSAGTYVYAAESQPTKEQKAQVQTEETKEDNTSEDNVPQITEEELAQYYGNSVFVGDSIMLGFRNYCTKKEDSFVHEIQFLAAGSYSAFNAAKPVTDKNVHPLYKGKKYQVWEAVRLMGVERVFILLGMNDISILGLEGARDQYKEVIDKILEVNPDVEIHIMSTTYTLKNAGKGKLNNENIAKYNELLKKMAEENGWGYMDVATPISDGKGNLKSNYCSDEYVHLNSSAYDIWETVLRNYAIEQKKVEEEPEVEVTTQTETEKNTEEQGNVQSKGLD